MGSAKILFATRLKLANPKRVGQVIDLTILTPSARRVGKFIDLTIRTPSANEPNSALKDQLVHQIIDLTKSIQSSVRRFVHRLERNAFTPRL